MTQPQVVMEWRVTGDPTIKVFNTIYPFPPYSFTWTSDRVYDANDLNGDSVKLTAEQAARRFIEMANQNEKWKDGPHLHSRMVIYNPWKLEAKRIQNEETA